jgi:hypothetical protein
MFIKLVNTIKNLRYNIRDRMINYEHVYKRCLDNIHYVNRVHKKKHYRLDIVPNFTEKDNSQIDLFIKYLIKKLKESDYLIDLQKTDRNHYDNQIKHTLHIFWDKAISKKYLKNKYNSLFFNFLIFYKGKLTIDNEDQ